MTSLVQNYGPWGTRDLEPEMIWLCELLTKVKVSPVFEVKQENLLPPENQCPCYIHEN